MVDDVVVVPQQSRVTSSMVGQHLPVSPKLSHTGLLEHNASVATVVVGNSVVVVVACSVVVIDVVVACSVVVIGIVVVCTVVVIDVVVPCSVVAIGVVVACLPTAAQ